MSNSRKPNENSDLKLVSDFFSRHGLKAERFSKAEKSGRRTPDFKIMRGENVFAYCEVKSPNDDAWNQEVSDELENIHPGSILSMARNDPIFDRLSNLIHKAYSQFNAVNPGRTFPNILIFVNHDDLSECHDLLETLTGYFHADDGHRHPTIRHVSEGRIRDEKYEVDLYIWIDAENGKLQACFFNEYDPRHRDSICDALSINKSNIEKLD